MGGNIEGTLHPQIVSIVKSNCTHCIKLIMYQFQLDAPTTIIMMYPTHFPIETDKLNMLCFFPNLMFSQLRKIRPFGIFCENLKWVLFDQVYIIGPQGIFFCVCEFEILWEYTFFDQILKLLPQNLE